MEKNPAAQEQTGYELMSRELINRKTAVEKQQWKNGNIKRIEMSWELINGIRNLLEYKE